MDGYQKAKIKEAYEILNEVYWYTKAGKYDDDKKAANRLDTILGKLDALLKIYGDEKIWYLNQLT